MPPVNQRSELTCIQTRAAKVPDRPEWIHEIKHDGYRLIIERAGKTVRLTDDMFARIPALLHEGMTKEGIAACMASTRAPWWCGAVSAAYRCAKDGALPKRTNLTLPDEPLPLSDGVLKSLREATRAMGKDSTARLVSDLLEKIASDGLYKAVPDEETT